MSVFCAAPPAPSLRAALRACLLASLCSGLTAARTPAQTAEAAGPPASRPSQDRPAAETRFDELRGTLLLTASPATEATRAHFARLARGRFGALLIITTASHRGAMVAASFFRGPWEGHFEAIEVVHPRTRGDADDRALLDKIRNAKAIWFVDGLPERLDACFGSSEAARLLRRRWREGAAIGAAGGAVTGLVDGRGGLALWGKRARFATLFREDWEAEDQADPARAPQRARTRERMLRRKQILAPTLRADFERMVRETPGAFGLRLGKGALLARGRQLRVLAGELELHLGPWRPVFAEPSPKHGRARIEKLAERASLDLEELRRSALARTRAPEAIGAVGVREELRAGAVLVGGGGELEGAIWTRFCELAGGLDAPILVVPTASGGPPAQGRLLAVDALQKAGARAVSLWHANTRAQADDAEYCAPLKKARGIWFPGGRQWRLSDRYEGTRALKLFAEVLRRGGVLGGTSAGCSIMAQCMVRGSPRGNRVMLAEGYERGFGLVAGVAIDQHFSQRERLPDLRALCAAYPRLTGVGVDESTALLWRGTSCRVLGAGSVSILEPGAELRVLGPGQSYDFASGK